MRVLWFLTAALCVFPPSSLGCSENLMTSSMKNLILKEHNDRRSEINNGQISSIKQHYFVCRVTRSQTSRCPGAPYYDIVRQVKKSEDFSFAVGKIPPLSWDYSLASEAQDWADNLACRPWETLVHSPKPPRVSGENLAWGELIELREPDIEREVADLIETWWAEYTNLNGYNQLFPYKSGENSDGKAIGHFTQMAWAKTTKVGCGVSLQKSGGKYAVILACNYYPPGNKLGHNVVPLRFQRVPESSGLQIRNGANEDSHIIPLATRG